MLTGLGLVALFAGMGIRVAGTFIDEARVEKLRGDVRHINQALMVYRANGGDLQRLVDPASVIAALQESRSQADLMRFAGAGAGSVLDGRVEAVHLPSEEVNTDRLRAIWVPGELMFKISNLKVPGIREFRNSTDLPGHSTVASDNRAPSALSYSTKTTWIWDYVEAPVTTGPSIESIPVFDPSSTPLATTPSPTTPSVPPTTITSTSPSGGLAVNLGSGTATAEGGMALNVLSNSTTSTSGQIAVGVAGVNLGLGGSGAILLNYEKSTALEPENLTQQITTFETGAGSGTTSAVNGIAASLGSGGSTAQNGISANAGEGESTATNGISGNLGSGSSTATNGLGLNLGTGSATAGSSGE